MVEKFEEQPLFRVETGDAVPGLWEEEDFERRADFQSRAPVAGADFKEIALDYLIKAGSRILAVRTRVCDGPVDAIVEGRAKRKLLVLSRGTPDDTPTAGLRREDTVLKVGFFGVQLGHRQRLPVVIVTSHLPKRESAPGRYLEMIYPAVAEVVATTGDLAGFQRLGALLHDEPLSPITRAPWRDPLPSQTQMVLEGIQISQEHIPDPRLG